MECSLSFLILVHVSSTSEYYLSDHADVLRPLTHCNGVVVWLVLTSCEVLHAIDGNIFVGFDIGIRFSDGCDCLSADYLQFVCNGSGRASVVVCKCALTESITVMEEKILQVDIDSFGIVVGEKYPFCERFATPFTSIPLYGASFQSCIVSSTNPP